MPVTGQIGEFVKGDVGKPVEMDITPPQTDIFTNVTAVTLNLTRPNGTAIAPRALPLPGCIVDVNGKLQFYTVTGDIPIAGIYTVMMGVDYVGGAHTNFGGDFNVTEN